MDLVAPVRYQEISRGKGIALLTSRPKLSQEWSAKGRPGRVSIITPAYNIEKYLSKAAASVASQTYTDWEWLLADDGSTDGTRLQIEALAAEDDRIRPLFSAENRGPFALRNWALAECTGQYIAFLDGDDFWAPEKLAAQVDLFQRAPEIGLSHHFMMRVDAAGHPTRRLRLSSEDFVGRVFKRMLRSNGVATSSVMARRSLLEATDGFDERFRYRGDWEMWTRLANACAFGFLPQDLGFYRVHDQNISRQTKKIRPYAFGILDHFETEFSLSKTDRKEFVKPARFSLHRGYGIMALVDRDYKEARKDLLAALRMRPQDRKTWVGLAKSIIYPVLRGK